MSLRHLSMVRGYRLVVIEADSRPRLTNFQKLSVVTGYATVYYRFTSSMSVTNSADCGIP